MKVGFVGTHSTGKTATAEALQTNDNVVFVPSSARKVYASKGKLNRDADRESQILTTLARSVDVERAWAENPDKIVVSDRTPLDSLAYTKYQMDHVWPDHELDEFYWTYSEKFVKSSMEKFDLLFFFHSSSIPLIGDGVRELDDNYRIAIETMLIDMITSDPNIARKIVVAPAGTIEQRANFIYDRIVRQNASLYI